MKAERWYVKKFGYEELGLGNRLLILLLRLSTPLKMNVGINNHIGVMTDRPF